MSEPRRDVVPDPAALTHCPLDHAQCSLGQTTPDTHVGEGLRTRCTFVLGLARQRSRRFPRRIFATGIERLQAALENPVAQCVRCAKTPLENMPGTLIYRQRELKNMTGTFCTSHAALWEEHTPNANRQDHNRFS